MRSIQEGRFCQGGKQKVNGEWVTYTNSDYDECKNGSITTAAKICSRGIYSIKEQTLRLSDSEDVFMQYVERYCDNTIKGLPRIVRTYIG